MSRMIVLVALSVVFVGFQSATHTDLSGTWQMDLTKSINLPESFQHVESYTMEVKQMRDSMIVMVRLTGNGQDVKFPLTSYALDGSETFREDTLRLSKRWNKILWTARGEKFIVASRVEQGQGVGAQKFTQRDVWKLTDKNTLEIAITQKYLSGKHSHAERRIFHRVK